MSIKVSPLDTGQIVAEIDNRCCPPELCILSVRSNTPGCVWLTSEEADALFKWLTANRIADGKTTWGFEKSA